MSEDGNLVIHSGGHQPQSKEDLVHFLEEKNLNSHLEFINKIKDIFGPVSLTEFHYKDEQIWPPQKENAMRPMYESGEDREKEFKVAKYIEKTVRSGVMHKLPIKYGVDFALESCGKIIRFYEIKCRNASYNDYRIALDKVAKARWLELSCRIGTTLVVTWPDGDGNVMLATDLGKISADRDVIWAGRKDRGDDQDMEPHVVIPIDEFEVMKRW